MTRSTTALAALAASVALVTLAGCSAGGSTTGGSDDSITIGLTTEPENLDYSTTDGAAIPQILLNNVYEGLVELDDEGQIAPSLASEWTVSEDGLDYTFTLRDDAVFSNGTPFTAESVAFTIDRVKSGDWTTGLASQMEIVDSVDVVSDTEVVVHLSSPSNSWLFNMATRVGTMYAEDGIDDLTETPVGTGPYEVASWTRGTSVVLERRDDYWGEAPAMELVTFQFYNDVNAANSALLSGAINVIPTLGSLDTLDQFSDESRFQILEGTTNSEVTLSMNNASGIFSDIRVRQAVNHAIDRQALIDSVVAGYGTLIGSNVPPTDPWYEDLSDTYEYDPELAEQLLDEAGVAGSTVRFRIPNTPATMVAAAQVVASDLQAVGLNAEIEVLDFPAVWLDQVFIAHDYDMSIVNHLEPRDISNFGNGEYYFGYDDATVQDLLARADAGTVDEQIALTQETARTITEDAVVDWLYLESSVGVAVTGIDGLQLNNLGESYDVTRITRG